MHSTLWRLVRNHDGAITWLCTWKLVPFQWPPVLRTVDAGQHSPGLQDPLAQLNRRAHGLAKAVLPPPPPPGTAPMPEALIACSLGSIAGGLILDFALIDDLYLRASRTLLGHRLCGWSAEPWAQLHRDGQLPDCSVGAGQRLMCECCMRACNTSPHQLNPCSGSKIQPQTQCLILFLLWQNKTFIAKLCFSEMTICSNCSENGALKTMAR